MTDPRPTTTTEGPPAPWPGPPAGPPPAGGGGTEGRAGDPPPSVHDRPAPILASLAGVAGGLFLLFALFLLLSEIGGDNQRAGGLAVSVLFEALGVGLLVLHRSRRASTAGVTLTAIGLIPLLVYLFVDVRNPGKTVNDVDSFTTTATGVLMLAAALWLAAYFFGPGRYAFYLGAALVAVWLVSVIQILDTPLNQVVTPFTSSGGFTQVVPSDDFGQFDDEFGTDEFGQFEDEFGTDEFGTDEFGTDEFGQFEDEFGQDEFESFEEPDDPSTKLGVASLLFGGAYLALGAWRDRRRDHRQATAFLAVSAPILTLAVPLLGQSLGDTGATLLGLALGGAAVWIGTRASRRFTSWFGTFAIVVAVSYLVSDAVGESARVSAAVLAVIGLAMAAAARWLDGPDDPTTSRPDGGPTGPATAAEPVPAGPAAWAPPGAAPAAGPPTGPPTGPAAWTPPSGPSGPSPDDAWAGPPLTPPPGAPAAGPPASNPWPASPPPADGPAPGPTGPNP